jgi:hypothetical protein
MPVERLYTKENTWTRFRDGNTGNKGWKTKYHKVYIQAPRDEAITLFKKRLDVDPTRTSCECCGQDYSIEEDRAPEEHEWESDNVLILYKDARLRYSIKEE